jgi:hypothetical protein
MLDASRADFVVAQALPATGTVLLGTDTSSQQSAPGVVISRPFSVMACLGIANASITASTRTGSTAVGTITVQVTDFGGVSPNDVFGIPANQWASTTYTVAITTGSQAVELNIPNTGWKFLRLSYTATSGTGTLDVALTARAVSRS